jgi:hypothetical protein
MERMGVSCYRCIRRVTGVHGKRVMLSCPPLASCPGAIIKDVHRDPGIPPQLTLTSPRTSLPDKLVTAMAVSHRFHQPESSPSKLMRRKACALPSCEKRFWPPSRRLSLVTGQIVSDKYEVRRYMLESVELVSTSCDRPSFPIRPPSYLAFLLCQSPHLRIREFQFQYSNRARCRQSYP